MKYILTPEFHRHLWLDFSPMKVAAIPLAFVIVMMAMFRIDGFGEKLFPDFCIWGYFIAVILWGNYESGNAFGEEVKAKTWDWQRMSTQAPERLFFSKIFGATAYAWYAGLMALAFYVGSSLFLKKPDPGFFYALFFMLVAGVLGHAVSFLAGYGHVCIAAKRGTKKNLYGGAAAFLPGFLVSLWMFRLVWEPKDGTMAVDRMYTWFGHDFAGGPFLVAGAVFFLFWAFVAVRQMARAELSCRVTPLCWAAMTAGMVGYFVGFLKGPVGSVAPLIYCMLLFVAYLTMLAEAGDIRLYRRFRLAIAGRDVRQVLENTPVWMTVLPLSVLAYFLVPGVMLLVGIDLKTVGSEMIFMTACAGFAVRDGLVVHSFYLDRPVASHIRFKNLFYFFMVYALLPMLHASMVSGDLSRSFGVFTDYWYYPLSLGKGVSLSSLVPLVLEVVIAFAWFRHRRSRYVTAE